MKKIASQDKTEYDSGHDQNVIKINKYIYIYILFTMLKKHYE